ncbi:DUF4144 family protein [Pseudoalteromonas piratica]|uniref:Uncharacterized protein n=1 Tax=Pseudoalteromonas piratica TaxID=1348114 RepID=A0A0A7EC49_9GAMM|nr:DUF4144 family protein [Pseudoalteromonas piratica]AIY64240.1 hypothetical protein OM33_03040 [Pseudoalteromonas piratica]
MNLIETLHYPVIIHYYGDDELEYVASAQQLQDLSASFVCDDALIDSQGLRYKCLSNGRFDAPQSFELTEFEQLLQKHAFALANCCITKMRITNFAEGITFVKESR